MWPHTHHSCNMEKKELRRLIKHMVKELSDEQKLEQSNAVFSHIENTTLFKHCRNVMLFASLPDELPTHHIIERWSKQKNVYLPRVSGDSIEVIKYEPGILQKGSYNILEPVGGELATPDILDLIIVPGVAFDRNGNRCGRGKGYYDRFLSQTHAATIAVCFDCQLVDNLPTEPHDIAAQHVVTINYQSI